MKHENVVKNTDEPFVCKYEFKHIDNDDLPNVTNNIVINGRQGLWNCFDLRRRHVFRYIDEPHQQYLITDITIFSYSDYKRVEFKAIPLNIKKEFFESCVPSQ